MINYTVQHAAGGGTNVMVADGAVAAAGANSSVVGYHDAITTGQDTAVPGAGEQPAKERWWARLRKRGAVVAFATVIGALAGVAGVIIAIMVAAGWKP